ncbi:MAG: hypothetical protein QGG60_04340 [Anaerolineales bacterium]|jgi:hypothetical protein|nr:hypothetical protein [Anaerolineaceae bacterium]MDP7346136.1 hypothetical protein [Anaerolineales bacterium]MDP7643913.1 hypothetical protein [Anaerolineales bacterium]HJN41952.1 hypothetical protein [Anaerolineales bacterium]
MYSYGMYPDAADLQALIAKAESGETEAARNGLRRFIQKHPSTLLAWKLLADVAENAKERSGAIRRAQLLAPGDPWVIEAKKHRRPPARRRRKPKLPTAPANQAAATTEAAEAVTQTEVESEAPGDEHSANADIIPPPTRGNATGANIAALSDAIQGPQPRWPVWVAAGMGAAGLALLAAAWQLGSF